MGPTQGFGHQGREGGQTLDLEGGVTIQMEKGTACRELKELRLEPRPPASQSEAKAFS